MDEKRKYDPEDIESLLIHKSFDELYPEEKRFVLEHLDSKDEYESMRRTLEAVMHADEGDETIQVNPEIKKELMAAMVSERRGGLRIWLNGLLAFSHKPQISWYRQPAFQLVAVAAVIVLGIFILTPTDNQPMLAEAQNTEQVESEKGEREEVESERDKGKGEKGEVKGEKGEVKGEKDDLLEREEFRDGKGLAEKSAEEVVLVEEMEEALASNEESLAESRDVEIVDQSPTDEVVTFYADDAATSEETIDAAMAQDLTSEGMVLTKEADFISPDSPATRSTATDIIIDTEKLASQEVFTFDNQMGNVAETTVLSSAETPQVFSDVQFKDEQKALFGGSDKAELTQAPTKKYKDLLDNLCVAY